MNSRGWMIERLRQRSAFRAFIILGSALGAGAALSGLLHGRRHSGASHAEGLIVLQLDGLALPILERALAAGCVPTLARWLRSGSHRVVPWQCALPSQTSASQAGILYGDNRAIGRVERAARRAPRPYQIVILSDHGQSQGATFRQCAGRSLEKVVAELLGDASEVQGVSSRGEGLGHLSALLSELLRAPRLRLTATRLFFGRPVHGASVGLSPGGFQSGEKPPDAVICASGNLALIYLARWPGRLTLDQIEREFPSLIRGLVHEPAVGFVLAHSAKHGAVAIGRAGRHFLQAGRGERPLSSFPHTGCTGPVLSRFLPAPGRSRGQQFPRRWQRRGRRVRGTHGIPRRPRRRPNPSVPAVSDLLAAPRFTAAGSAWTLSAALPPA